MLKALGQPSDTGLLGDTVVDHDDRRPAVYRKGAVSPVVHSVVAADHEIGSEPSHQLQVGGDRPGADTDRLHPPISVTDEVDSGLT